MLLEKLPAIQSLAPEEKWLLIDELWSDLARQVESAPADAQTVALLEARFAEYCANPDTTAHPMEEVFARLAERKRQWK
jgi:putative addiction module component (TIGR02574 family)